MQASVRGTSLIIFGPATYYLIIIILGQPDIIFIIILGPVGEYEREIKIIFIADLKGKTSMCYKRKIIC